MLLKEKNEVLSESSGLFWLNKECISRNTWIFGQNSEQIVTYSSTLFVRYSINEFVCLGADAQKLDSEAPERCAIGSNDTASTFNCFWQIANSDFSLFV